MARTLRMFSSEFPYEGGKGDVTDQDVPDAWFIDKEEAYGAGTSPPLQRGQIRDIGADVAAIMFGAVDQGASITSSRNPPHKAAREAYRRIGTRAQVPYQTEAGWVVQAKNIRRRTGNLDRHMIAIAQGNNVNLFKATPKAGGAPAWIFTLQRTIAGRTTGVTISQLNRAT